MQAQTVDLLADLNLFIPHDPGVAKHTSTRVVAMDPGKVLEVADKRPLPAIG